MPVWVNWMGVRPDSESLRRQPNLRDTPLLAQDSRAGCWGRGQGGTSRSPERPIKRDVNFFLMGSFLWSGQIEN